MKQWIKNNPEAFAWIVIFIIILLTAGIGAVIIGVIFISYLKNVDVEEEQEEEEITEEEALEELGLLEQESRGVTST